jgi:uncharacterized protein (DUF2141 family)
MENDMKRTWSKSPMFMALALSAALPLAAPATAWSSDLALKVENVRSPGGDLRIAVYGSEADYRKTPVRAIKVAAAGDPVAIRISGLAPGDYAVALYHDRNGNEKLDSNLMGIPTEPYGFSGVARNLMGPATWQQAKFNLPAEGGAVNVRLSD